MACLAAMALPAAWAAAPAAVPAVPPPTATGPGYDFEIEVQKAGARISRIRTTKKAGENFIIQMDEKILIACYPTPEGKDAVLLTCVTKTLVGEVGAKNSVQTELLSVKAVFGKKINTKLGQLHPDVTLVVEVQKVAADAAKAKK